MWLIVSFYATFFVELILNMLVGSLHENLWEVLGFHPTIFSPLLENWFEPQ